MPLTLSLTKSLLFIFVYFHCLRKQIKKEFCCKFMLGSLMPMFYSKSFIVFGLTFRSLIHFAYGVRESSNFILHFLHVVVQSLGGIQLFVNTQIEAPQGPLSFAIFWNLFQPISIKQVMPSIHLVLSRFLLLLPSTFPSIRAFSNESAQVSCLIQSCISHASYCSLGKQQVVNIQ